ncbi:MAG: ABC transporter substrate-binding protein [Chloroflexota bacterium]
MMKKRFTVLSGLLLIVALAVSACTSPTGTVQEAIDQVAPTLEAAVEELAPTIEAAATEVAETVPEAEATVEEEVTEEPMSDFEPLSVAAEDCEYGGKILSIEAVDEYTVQFNLCKSDPAFLSKIAFTPFGIQPMEWLMETGGTGQLLEQPVGTGPYMVERWLRGDSITFTRFDDYWGDPAIAQTAVLRWNQEGQARLLELQAGTADMITNVPPDDMDAVENDPNLQLLPSGNPNILYLGMTNTFEPFDNVDVRKAIAMGIDKQRIVDNFFPEGSEVADYFTPCSIPGGCEGEGWYDFDPEAARQLLADAGYPDGFETAIYYRDVYRVYLPEPGVVAVELQDQLQQNLGITAEVVQMESGEFIAEATDGRLDGLYLLGWGADYPHPTNFLDFHFGVNNPQFGDAHPEIYESLESASKIADINETSELYAQANNAIRELVPMVPLVHGKAADAALSSLGNAYVPPFGATQFYKLDPGKDTLVFVQNAEPISLYCADETDGESLRPCQQAVETLLEYSDDSGDVVPELALSCEANEDATVWTCALRQGVMFHNGAIMNANDVVYSWAVGIDASNPNHVGNTGGFDYFAYLWDGLMNVSQEE